MPQDRIKEINRPMDKSFGEGGYIDGPPPEAFSPVQSKTPSMMHQERIRSMSAARTMGKMGPMSQPASPPPGPIGSTTPLIHAGTPFTPGMRPQASSANDPDIRSRNRNSNPNMPGIIVPKPDL